MMPLRLWLVCAVLAVLLLSASVCARSSSSTGGAGPRVGSVTVVKKATFSDPNDSFDCLALSGNGVHVFAASGGGDIFTYDQSDAGASTSIKPSFTPAAGVNGLPTVNYVACQASNNGATLWLLDERSTALYSWSYETPSTAPLLVASFPDEQPGAVQALAVDTTNFIAYVGTRSSDLIYSVNVKLNNTAYSAFDAAQVNTDITAMVLSKSLTQLWYAAPSPSEGAPGSINSLTVSKGTVQNSQSPIVHVSSASIVWVDTLLFNLPQYNNILYWKDGGGLHGTGNPGGDIPQSITQFKLTSRTRATLYTTSTGNMPTGLAILPTNALLFTTTNTINSLAIAPIAVSSSTGV